MSTVWLHLRRYACWCAFGVCLTILPIIFVCWIKFDSTPPTAPLWIAGSLSGIILVLVRAAIGAVTRLPAGAADRATAIGIRRFFEGCLIGLVFAFFLNRYYLSVFGLSRLSLRRWEWVVPLGFLAGGVFAVLTARLLLQLREKVHLPRPSPWFAILAAILFGWFLGTR
jgi:hypothetical protein